MRLRELLVPTFFVLSGLIVLWDILLAGQISQLRRAPPFFRALTAIVGLLVAPALLIAIASSTILTGRAIHAISWVWPATLVLFAAQAFYATSRGLVTPFIGLPIFVYDLLIAIAALTRYSLSEGGSPAPYALAFNAAQASTLGLVIGRLALFSPYALFVPLLGPAYPARWRASATVRGALALASAAWAILFIAELPRGYVAVRSYARYATEPLQERPRGDFAVGLRIFPALRAGPPPLALRNDLSLLDNAELGAVSIVLVPESVRAIALDSLARSIDQLRRDSVLLVIELGYPRDARARFRSSPRDYLRQRVTDAERIARRLRPDYLVVAMDPYGEGRRALGDVPIDWWQEYLRLASRDIHRVSRRIRVGASFGAFTARDSALYLWAAADASPVDVLGFALFPSYGGGVSLDARMRTADRWMRRSSKEHWVFAAGGYPVSHGERSQERAVWGTLAWATSHARVRGLIVEGAGDYDALTGLRAPGGRLRPAAGAVGRALRALEETRRQ